MEPHAEMIFRHAYYKDSSVIKKELDLILADNQYGIKMSDIDRTIADTWRLVSPAFTYMGLHPSREIDSKKDMKFKGNFIAVYKLLNILGEMSN